MFQGGVLRSDGPLSAFNIYDGQKIVLMELKEAPASNVPAAGMRKGKWK